MRRMILLLTCITASLAPAAPVTAQDRSAKALADAIAAGRGPEVDRLLASGTRIEPFHMGLAAMGRHPEMVRVLVEHGADPDVMNLGPGQPLQSTLGFLAPLGRVEALRMLLELGADPDYRTEPGKATPLMAALLGGKLEAVRVLMEFGADPSLTNAKGETAGDLAVATSALTGDRSFVEALGAAVSPEASAALDMLERGLDIDGTHQEGFQTLSEDREEYLRGGFTGPCLSRRVPLMDPAHPDPGDAGSGSYRETHVSFEGGMKVGSILPPECTPLHLGPGTYRVSVIGADVSWVWRCRQEASTCLLVQKDDTADVVDEEFHVTVLEDGARPRRGDDSGMSRLPPPGDEPGADRQGGSCRVGGVRIVAPNRGTVYQASASGGGTLADLVAQAEIAGDRCGETLGWNIDDVAGVGATQRALGRSVAFGFTGLPPADPPDTVAARITVRLGSATDTLTVRVVLPPAGPPGPR